MFHSFKVIIHHFWRFLGIISIITYKVLEVTPQMHIFSETTQWGQSSGILILVIWLFFSHVLVILSHFWRFLGIISIITSTFLAVSQQVHIFYESTQRDQSSCVLILIIWLIFSHVSVILSHFSSFFAFLGDYFLHNF